MQGLTVQDLQNFEKDIESHFLNAEIRAPVHFSQGNEEMLLKIAKWMKPNDWVFSNHRSHLHALIHGIPKEWLKEQILAGNSMHINSNKYKFVTSSIVAGCVSIAVGVAEAIKNKGAWHICEPPYEGVQFYRPFPSSKCMDCDAPYDSPDYYPEHVWCFIGDAAGESGIFYENAKYAEYNQLPITFVVECNNLATNSPTGETWGIPHEHHTGIHYHGWLYGGIYHYCYTRTCCHINVDSWVELK